MSGRITTAAPFGSGDSARAAANSVPSAEVKVRDSAAAPPAITARPSGSSGGRASNSKHIWGSPLVDRRGRGRQDRWVPETVKVDPSASLGASFADALAAKDFERIDAAPDAAAEHDVLTPRRDSQARR